MTLENFLFSWRTEVPERSWIITNKRQGKQKLLFVWSLKSVLYIRSNSSSDTPFVFFDLWKNPWKSVTSRYCPFTLQNQPLSPKIYDLDPLDWHISDTWVPFGIPLQSLLSFRPFNLGFNKKIYNKWRDFLICISIYFQYEKPQTMVHSMRHPLTRSHFNRIRFLIR